MNKVIKNESKLITICLIISSAFAFIINRFSQSISGNDYWWHVKVGEWICKNGRVPHEDIFSWVGMQQHLPWIAHEWLADVIFYKIQSAAGEIGIYILSLIAFTTMFILIVVVNRKKLFDNIFFTVFFLALFCVSAGQFFYGRPHLFSSFLLFFEMYILWKYNENDSKLIFLLPVISMIWSNIHSGSANLAYILPIILWAGGIWNFNFGRLISEKKSFKHQIIILALSVLSFATICVNPIGIDALKYPYMQMSEDLQMNLIAEWAAPDIKDKIVLITHFLPVLLTLMWMFISEKKVKLVDFLFAGAFSYLFFRSSRFIFQYWIVVSFWSFDYVIQYQPRERVKILSRAAAIITIVALLVFGVNGIKKMSDIVTSGECVTKELSDEAIKKLKEDGAYHIFNDYNYGSDLVYNDIEVFYDGRADLFAQCDILKDGAAMTHLKYIVVDIFNTVDIEMYMDKYEIENILLINGRPLCSYMFSHPEKYELIFEEGTAVYFKRIS